jgi:hypothetical protein
MAFQRTRYLGLLTVLLANHHPFLAIFDEATPLAITPAARTCVHSIAAAAREGWLPAYRPPLHAAGGRRYGEELQGPLPQGGTSAGRAWRRDQLR